MITSVERAKDVNEVYEALRRGCVIVAGGTDYVPAYSMFPEAPVQVVDIRAVSSLAQAPEASDGTFSLSALSTLNAVSQMSAPWLGALRDGAGLIGSRQTRFRGTLGGNICRASPSGDTLAALLVLDARAVLGSWQGRRELAARELFLGPGKTEIRTEELLETVQIPAVSGASAYARSTVRRGMDLATAGVAVAIRPLGQSGCDVTIALGGVAPTPVLTVEQTCEDPSGEVDRFVAQIQERISPIDDVRGSAWYRRQLVRPLLAQAISVAEARLSARAAAQ